MALVPGRRRRRRTRRRQKVLQLPPPQLSKMRLLCDCGQHPTRRPRLRRSWWLRPLLLLQLLLLLLRLLLLVRVPLRRAACTAMPADSNWLRGGQ
jgi:hypothetical protein